MRQYGEVPPTLGAGPAPKVSIVTGLGTGGGASVFTQDGSGYGDVFIQTGKNPDATWEVQIEFSSAPPTLFVSGDDALGILEVSQVGTTLTVNSTDAFWSPNTKYQLHYEWAVSQ